MYYVCICNFLKRNTFRIVKHVWDIYKSSEILPLQKHVQVNNRFKEASHLKLEGFMKNLHPLTLCKFCKISNKCISKWDSLMCLVRHKCIVFWIVYEYGSQNCTIHVNRYYVSGEYWLNSPSSSFCYCFVIDILIEVSIVQGTGCFISKCNKYI